MVRLMRLKEFSTQPEQADKVTIRPRLRSACKIWSALTECSQDEA